MGNVTLQLPFASEVFASPRPSRCPSFLSLRSLARPLLAVALTVALCGVADARTKVDDLSGSAIVLDGDTLAIGSDKVRLHGVDAFEAEQTCTDARGEAYGCGGRATRYLASLVLGGLVACSGRDVDQYGRLVAVCSAGSVDLGAALVRAGHAVAYRRYSADYIGLEAGARAARAGAWSGTFVPSADYRARARGGTVAVAQRAAPQGVGACAIKGNVNRKGQRIYHLPADPYYAPTRPEAMFCSEREAEAAGFRRAGRTRG